MIDVLVIGSGGTGLSAALAAKEAGASVLVIGKMYPTNSQTSMAQGGMNAALGNVNEDHISLHIQDTIKSAHGLCNEDMVRQMCGDAPKTIEWLETIGVPFSRIDASGAVGGQHPTVGTIAQRQMGGASAKRACYAQDYTGLKILHTLYDTCLKEGIEFLDEHYLLNLIVPKDTVKGATFLDIRTGEVKQIDAKSIVMATGGYGSIYHGFTTNMYGATGDGIAAVLRAGGAVSDMEFIQFHPTALKHSCILISESARGEGGYLVNEAGERFVDELKPRDEVARAIFAQMKEGQRVFLDVRHLGEAKLMELLPQEVELCKIHEHVDPAKELIPIKPVAHYSMGGIDVDHALEVNGIKGCFAAGECSNAKVHGANRLGGNSLLEITAFGRFAGENAYKHTIYASSKPADDIQKTKDKTEIESLFSKEEEESFYSYRELLGELFYEKVGIVRENGQLNESLEEVIAMQVAQKKMGIADKSRSNNQNLIEFLEFKNALLLAPTIISAAIARDESRGAHYKVGFEEENEAFRKHVVLQWKKESV
ncbi:FAD-dependent oxidoreductase [Sulfurovum sp. NBC37-1]|uniref:FAD-dependent oxidoreductase n=1 Tax=Sulfurovum sp. (strain NBC37-1) TaxID=387093 RepID=UPI000158744F|nr:FAD-dependent oxidoreductase [Sulfurovum sp. NBC37-1]BAF71112.1 succinate dehydrogenase/fumarate reductase, flavoprotein subunit [Sulfurovum sp. NBC37-1]